MKTGFKDRPRIFDVGTKTIKDYGELQLDPWEMVTLKTEKGRRCDLTATDWGFYLGASVNVRMRKEGFRVALVQNEQGKLFVNAVEEDKIKVFLDYLQDQEGKIIKWLDDEQNTY